LLRDSPARGRNRLADPVRRADLRCALGSVRLPRARPPPYLGGARPLARRAHADRGDLARRTSQRSRGGRLWAGGDQFGRVLPDRRARRAGPRSDLSVCLGLSLRNDLLVAARTVVELPGTACRRPRLAPREPGVDTSAPLAADAVDGRPGRDRALRTDRQRPPPYLRYPSRNHGDAGARRG